LLNQKLAAAQPGEADGHAILNPDLPTFSDLLSEAAKAFPDQEAFVHGSDRVTYGEWVEQSLRVAAAFSDRGVKPGDIILIGIESSIDFAICFAAAQLAGAIASGINTRLGRRETDSIVKRSNAALIVLENDAAAPAASPAIQPLSPRPISVSPKLAATLTGWRRRATGPCRLQVVPSQRVEQLRPRTHLSAGD